MQLEGCTSLGVGSIGLGSAELRESGIDMERQAKCRLHAATAAASRCESRYIAARPNQSCLQLYQYLHSPRPDRFEAGSRQLLVLVGIGSVQCATLHQPCCEIPAMLRDSSHERHIQNMAHACKSAQSQPPQSSAIQASVFCVASTEECGASQEALLKGQQDKAACLGN